MNIKNLINFVFVFLLFRSGGYGQEVLTGLQVNPVIKEKIMRTGNMQRGMEANDTIPILLPFLDDFSKSDVFPDETKWYDRYGFVNTDFPINPVNLGVITLDAINDSGNMYPEAVPGPEVYIADYLTSRYIRLDSVFTPLPKALSPSDSLYFSFYYQPQGRGSAPKTNDSLILQFLFPAYDSITPTDTIHFSSRWRNVWSTKGLSLDTFYLQYNRYFRQVMVPVKRQVLFNKYFRFRFYNYVSLASSGEPSWQSNCSEWNLDQIYLNSNRSIADSVFKEIRFIDRPPSMLRQYASMPYPQYSDDPSDEMIDTIAMTIRNRDTINHKIFYKYEVAFPDGTLIMSYALGKDSTIRPYPEFNELTLRPPVKKAYPISSADSALFVLKHFTWDKLPGSSLGDTIISEQKMFNYYAYDDGTPERGYGITRAGSRLAYRFTLNKSPDTLRAITAFFNKTLSNANLQTFFLTVWNDNNGKPGDTIYSRSETVKFADNLNKFVTYHLEVPVRISGTFYIGMITTTDDNLNIGFDRHNNAQDNLLFNTTGQWNTSAYSGSLLMRPIVGKPIPLGITSKHILPGVLSIYPDPCSTDNVTITCKEQQEQMINPCLWGLSVINPYGQKVLSMPYSRNLNVSGLSDGFYLIEIRNPSTGQRFIGKLIITR